MPQADTDSYPYSETNAHANTASYSYPNSETNSHADTASYSYPNSETNAHANPTTYAYSHTYSADDQRGNGSVFASYR